MADEKRRKRLIFIFAAQTLLLIVASVSNGAGIFNPALLAAIVATIWNLLLRKEKLETPLALFAPLIFLVAYLAQETAEGRLHAETGLLFGFTFGGMAVGIGLSKKGWPCKLFVVFLLILLAVFSARSGGADHMQPYFNPWFSPAAMGTAILIVRKSIHSTFYPLLGFSLLRSMETIGWRRKDALLRAWPLVANFAIFDEVRQSTMPNREGSWRDVLLDLTATTILFAFLYYRHRRRGTAA